MTNKILLALVVAAATVALDANAKKPAPAKAAANRAAEPVAVDVPPPSGTWEAKAPAAEGYVWSASSDALAASCDAFEDNDLLSASPGPALLCRHPALGSSQAPTAAVEDPATVPPCA